MAAGADAVVSHAAAASLHELLPRHGNPVHLTVAVTTGATVFGARVHRTRSIDKRDIAMVGPVPVTSVGRTIVDLARSSSEGRLRWLVDRALVSNVASIPELAETAGRLASG